MIGTDWSLECLLESVFTDFFGECEHESRSILGVLVQVSPVLDGLLA